MAVMADRFAAQCEEAAPWAEKPLPKAIGAQRTAVAASMMALTRQVWKTDEAPLVLVVTAGDAWAVPEVVMAAAIDAPGSRCPTDAQAQSSIHDCSCAAPCSAHQAAP